MILGLENDLIWFHVKSEWQKNTWIFTLCHIDFTFSDTRWKLQDFAATQILREINFKAPNTALWPFEQFWIFDTFKCEISPKIKISGLQNCQIGSVWLSGIKLISRKIPVAENFFYFHTVVSKIPKFSHCASQFPDHWDQLQKKAN